MHCKGRMVWGTAPFSLDRNGYHVSWDAIPAWVCSQCGEPFFESREVELIQKAHLGDYEKLAQKLKDRVDNG